MSLEQFKTQVLLLHSEQRTLDLLSKGFNDRYSVHCATSGTEALNALGDLVSRSAKADLVGKILDYVSQREHFLVF